MVLRDTTGSSINEDANAVAAIDSIARPAETTSDVIQLSDGADTSPAEIEQPVIPLPPRRAIPHHLVCEELASAAADNGIPAPFLIKLINQESGFNQHVVSKAGAQGVAQFMPETAAQVRLDDPFNPLKAVRASAQLLRNLFEQFGHKLGLAAAAYNAGPRRVQDWLDKKGSLPQETRDYVEKITGRKADDWKAGTAAAQFRVPPNAPCQREAGLFAWNGPAAIPFPPALRGTESRAVVAPKSGGAKIIKIALTTTKSATKSAKAAEQKSKTMTITVAAKRATRPGKTKKLQVADAKPHK
ncbi:MAG: transglycosylase SLT domain-containing protein [Pseudolabrys sp.]|nr:transglycosylase SLT domain-containing protein [Pseudolabrys sp.]